MSAALYIVLEQDVPGFDEYVNGRALTKHEQELDLIAKRLSITPLMEFFSVAPEEAAGFVEDHGGDPALMTFEEEQWHEASAGLASVRTLWQYLTKHPEAIPDAGAVQEDLSEFERVLQSAQTHGIRWHLAVDY